MLHGRANEAARIVSLLDQARSGRSGVLVIRGQAGIGKSALLEYAGESATGMRVLRIGGVESESELPFAGLHLLLRPCLDRIDTLPRGQERALRTALGLDPGEGGDRFLVGLAVLTLLSELAEERALLCLIDDAHWLDHGSAQALLFAARRLHAEPIAVMFAARDEDAPEFLAPDLAELRLAGLDDGAADRLLAERADPVPAHLRPNVLAEARGNPLALLELATTAGAGRAERPETSSTYQKLRQTFLRRVAALPGRTQVLLLVTAAADSGDRSVVLPAARALGCTVADLEPAERARLLRGVEGRLESAIR
jgi:AAA ATPase-like protein